MEDVQLTIAMSVWKKHNRPAENTGESNKQFTTNEILEQFQALLGPEVIDHEMMYDLLTAHGFIFDYVIDEFKWLVMADYE